MVSKTGRSMVRPTEEMVPRDCVWTRPRPPPQDAVLETKRVTLAPKSMEAPSAARRPPPTPNMMDV